MEKNKRENFKSGIAVLKDNEKQRILELKEKYENNEIFEKDLSDKDMKAIIQLYQEEEKEIDRDIQKRKQHIATMLKK